LVTISFDPLNRAEPWASLAMPLWGLLFCGVFIGVVIGWTACWLAQGKWRRATRDSRANLQRAEAEVLKLKQEAQRNLVQSVQP
jgi:hypothetical protein